jgi:DNA-binding LacI/PurR family transcriptional regulator
MLAGMSDEEELGFSSSRDRREGYRLAMEAAGLGPRDDLLVAGTHGIDGGAEAMLQVLSGEILPTAIFAEYDELAIGAMRTMRQAGIAVPDQISIVGIDDHEMASVVDLTTVAQPVHELGAVAARLLLDTVSGRLLEPTEVVLPTRLLLRGSTGRAPERATA